MPHNEPLVSIVMPVYNASEVLAQTLSCLETQTLASFEVLCVDDGSTDDSAAIIETFAARDQRFCLVSKQNGGAASARNMGMEQACGHYLMFLDADDTYVPTMLEELVEAIEQGGADVCVCEVDSYDHVTGAVSARYRLPKQMEERTYTREELEPTLFQTMHNSTWNKLYLRSFVMGTGLAFQDLPSSNDAFFVQCSLAYARRIAVLKRSLVVYRINRRGSIQDGRAKHPLCPLDAAQKTYDRVASAGLLSEAGMRSLRNRCWQQAIEAVMAAADTGNKDEMEQVLARVRGLADVWGISAWGREDFSSWDAAYLYWCFTHASASGLVWAYKANDTDRARRTVWQKARVAMRLGVASMGRKQLGKKAR